MTKADRTDSEGCEKVNAMKKASNELYVIGIGASAGGLQALGALFSHVPYDSVAYIIVQHLSAEHRSFLKELLKPHSVLEILEAQPNMLVEPNKVYVIPNNKELTIENNFLQLNDKALQDRSKTIDVFFKSLAKDKEHRAIGIILSGTGTDGTEGAVAIKKAGGMVMVQKPASAKFDGMPRNAINTGYADFILEPALMPNEIFNYIKVSPIVKEVTDLVNYETKSSFFMILDMIRNRSGIDFSNYKRPTIIRRISRRMATCEVSSLTDYLDYLHLHPKEIEVLGKEFLIGVTRFFRDEEAYEIIAQEVIPALVDKKSRSEQLRIWVAGCSTGEEAYSLAILIREFMDKVKKELEVKIFASDIDRDALEYAGKGLYQKKTIQGMSEERLQKNFVKEEGKYRICQRVRRMVIFAPHNVTKDPPFSKIDMVSCRNMLIYLNPLLQKKVIEKFQYALLMGGYLFLGSSESLSDLKSFIEVNKKWKIFRNTEPARSLGMENFASNSLSQRSVSKTIPGITRDLTSRQLMQQNFSELLNETILNEYGVAAVYVDEQYEILHGVGRIKNYLYLPEQNFTFNLLKLVPHDLASNLSTLLRKAARDNQKVAANGIPIRNDNAIRYINIVINPYLQDSRLNQKALLVLFSDSKPEPAFVLRHQGQAFLDSPEEARVQELETELQHTKEDLQAVVEELETSNEELQSTKEELQSTNEELQSLNEELHTINTEHHDKIKALMELDDDLNNYFRSTDIGQIFVDRKLIIRKYTPAAARLINLIESDIGRSISQIPDNLQYNSLIEDIKTVILKTSTIEKEVQDKQGLWYQMRILPYITQDRKIDGAIIIFIHINELKNLQLMQSGIIDSSPNAIIALKAIRNHYDDIMDFRLTVANLKVQELFGMSEKLLLDSTILKVWPNSINQGLLDHLAQVVEEKSPLELEQQLQLNGNLFWLHIVAVKFGDGLVLTLHNITERKLYEQELKEQQKINLENADRSRTLLETVPHITWTNKPGGENISLNEAWYNYTGLSVEESAGWGWSKAIHPDDLKVYLKKYEKALEFGKVLDVHARLLRGSDKKYRTHLLKNVPIMGDDGKVELWIGTATDIQDYKDAEEANIHLRLSQHREILKAMLQAQESERKNISEALHNGLGQTLYATKLNLDQLKPQAKQEQQILSKIDNLLKESIKATRDISFILNPSVLIDFGLQDALKEIISRISSPKLKIRLKVSGFEQRLEPFVELSIFRIVQELMNNIIRHAQATKASVDLQCEQNRITLLVQDNGIGFEKAELITMKGIGLRSIQHRLELLEGTIEIDSEASTGSLIKITCKI
ncbi:PAS domain S-box protein [Pontibacter qinzhouensis]|uniref:protein-glutamate O-methyltransferase n=1 Tax=Pontibacter qinzhouensis TaxID=2603253 RepID=A0A5C8IZI6_9BACT|nr:CheR family methyltransferase [Pontibacter qinzhouensis]TXK27244.1 PAS domain S-box protein [Pontibacter qinzhouensis]